MSRGFSVAPKSSPYLAATARFAAGDDDPRKFLESCLERFDLWEPQIGSFVNVNLPAARDAADASAARWRSGKQLSAIDGMPIGIKDVIETVDMPTGLGSPLFEGWQSGKDAASVAALREAGAVIVGKNVTTEFAMMFPNRTRNPWNLDHTPGGSSSGSAAAVAAGLVSASVGTQVLGSIVRPASFCGVVGFKPTVHALNRLGSHDFQSQSCNGVLAATLEDAWQVAYEIAQRAGGDAGWPALSGPPRVPAARKPRQLAFLETAGWGHAGDSAKQCLFDALERIRAQGVTIITRGTNSTLEAVESNIAEALDLSLLTIDFEMRGFLQSCASRDINKLSPPVRERLAAGTKMSLADYQAALARREQIRASYARLASDCDACVTLGAVGPAPKINGTTGSAQMNIPATLLGVPAITVPQFMVDDMPLGLQVMGFSDRDADAFAVAAWLRSLF